MNESNGIKPLLSSHYCAAPLSDVVVDMTGFDPGTWDMLLVRERT